MRIQHVASNIALLGLLAACAQGPESNTVVAPTTPRFSANTPGGQDLTVTKSPSSQSVDLGGQISWTITVSNAATADNIAANSQLTDALPAVAGVTWQISGSTTWGTGTCGIVGNDLTCGTGIGNPLNRGETRTVTVIGTTSDPAACTTYTNTATFFYGDGTPKPSFPSNTASLEVKCPPPPAGCTLTQGFWKTHSTYGPAPSDAGWNNLPDQDGDATAEGPDETFFASGKTWIQLWGVAPGKAGTLSPARTGGYVALAHQYMAAVLNVANGATPTAAVTQAIADAAAYFSGAATTNPPSSLATTLTQFNEGTIGPGHCDDKEPID
jgi:uncharacterized repeat protein (TIGR01451 family)